MVTKISAKRMKKIAYFSAFLLIVSSGMFLRFYKIERAVSFNWDQGRDAWEVRDIIQGKHSLKGPRTGIGDFYLGPTYYYLLTPFFLLSSMDPKGSNYFNMAAIIFNFAAIYFAVSKIFSQKAALLAIFIYAVNRHAIAQDMIPWNVSPLFGVSALIFLLIYKVSQGNYRLLIPLAALVGFATQLHFTAVFLPLIALPALFIAKDKKKFLLYGIIAAPFFLTWLLPSIIFDYSRHHDNYYRIQSFFRDYYLNWHFRFMIFRLPDAFIQFSNIIYFPTWKFVRYLPLFAFLLLVFAFNKNNNYKILAILSSFWFLVPLIGFTFYSGQISQYYFSQSFFAALITIIYLQKRILQTNAKPLFVVLLFVFWVYYGLVNTQPYWNKPTKGGLAGQREELINRLNGGETFPYIEGDIKSYIFTIMKDKGVLK